ncbi:hypothetical protein AaE_012590 [Aphanomyces astaci]|uniref:Uncharacterized protein n=1 Tax=Aphanomyces astaci TaxID=112090 RepID=A0A6A4ZFM4_APHAT|nr:hypothetical protein AaE_012590 [Aphanomyces astaci]
MNKDGPTTGNDADGNRRMKLQLRRERSSQARSTERMYNNWGCFSSPVKPLPDVLQNAHAFGSSAERDTLDIVDQSVPDYPGPGQYPTNEITTAFNTVKDYSIQNIPDVRPRPETPGPGHYTSNYGAVMASQTFDDYFRTAPLKNLSTCQVKIKQITREIKQLKYKKALALPSLPVEKQKAMCNETFDLVQALLLEKAALEADEAEARQLANPRARATTRRKNAVVLPSYGEIAHSLARPKSVPFMHTEKRFFDAIDITHTKYETPMPGHCQRLDAHSTFEKSPRLPTIPKGTPPDVIPFHDGYVFASKANPNSETGPGAYMPDVVGAAPPSTSLGRRTKSGPQLTLQLFHHSTNTKLPATQYLAQGHQDRQRKRVHAARQLDIDLVRQLGDASSST